MQSLDAEKLTVELVRALRGKRTQTGFSRALGYRSNIVHRWETAQCAPRAARFLSLCLRLKPATVDLFPAFLKRTPSWHDARAPFGPSSVAAFLRELRGKAPIAHLAQHTGYNRYQIGRWLAGKAEPRLPEFLALVEAESRRLPDLLAALVDPGNLPSVAARWKQTLRAREAAYSSPISHAVLRALELESYRKQPPAQACSWLSQQLGISREEVEAGLAVLHTSGQVKKRAGRFVPHRVLSVETSHDPERARALKASWAELALGRLRAGLPGFHGYSVFATSRAGLTRLRELELEYVRGMQSVIASAEPAECVGVYCVHLLDLSSVDNALA
jgi:hypothetical protein